MVGLITTTPDGGPDTRWSHLILLVNHLSSWCASTETNQFVDDAEMLVPRHKVAHCIVR
jgi:hypothetical protein